MKKVISCCGVICSECQYYPDECAGCPAIQGQVFWLEYVGAELCPIYECCVNQKRYAHCGQCEHMTCEKYDLYDDPNITEEEARLCRAEQIKVLKALKK